MTGISTEKSFVFPILMLNIFLVNLITGMMLSVLPLYLHYALSQSTTVIGSITGLQFITALVCRVWAGTHSDRHGAKSTIVIGLTFVIGSTTTNLLSLFIIGFPLLSILALASGRAFLGAAECFSIVGAVSWALGLMGRNASGKAIAQMGIAMYIGLAVGAPVGTLIYTRFGMQWVVLSGFLAAAIGLLFIFRISSPIPSRQTTIPYATVIKAIWKPGVGLGFASFGYGAMITFAMLLFTERNWTPTWLGFSSFACSFILARLLFSNLPDRLGGAYVASVFAAVQFAGLLILALAPWAILGFMGAALIGFGYSMVYPGLGLEAVLRSPLHAKGLAVGGYTAFLELTLGICSPLLGFSAETFGLGSVFLVSAVFTVGTLFISLYLRTNPPN